MLDASQQQAVSNISKLTNRVYLLIGAGGSGKTYTIQHLLQQLWADSEVTGITNETTFLAAPTGKAAKVLNDAFSLSDFQVDNEAKTIHRLLGYVPGIGWTFNADNPLDATLVVLDESSMIDSVLLSTLIDALPDGCVLIMVGDDKQLPPVNPGQPFTDLILGRADIANRLTTNHRQAQGSLIADACLKILDGKKITIGTLGENTLGGSLQDDLFFIEREDKEDIPETVVDICRPWHEQNLDYAVLAPQKKGVCGVDALNKFLQEKLNPPDERKSSLKVAWLTFRVGDKVLQTKNNYALDVFNGFTGIITGIDEQEEIITVDFDGHVVVYSESEHIKQLALGYCMTVHKAQGSQFKYGVLVCHSSHYYMWSRSLLYTGFSRFRRELHVIGDKKAIKRGLSNVVSGERNTLLKLRLSGEEV